jgi:hypothetical protein
MHHVNTTTTLCTLFFSSVGSLFRTKRVKLYNNTTFLLVFLLLFVLVSSMFLTQFFAHRCLSFFDLHHQSGIDNF